VTSDVQFWTVFVLTAVLIGAAFAAMAVGVAFSGRCLRGSCGGPAGGGRDGEAPGCANCPNRNRGANASTPPPSS
jgi:hypothetical protein